MTSSFFWLIVIAVFVLMCKNPVFKGWIGEFIVNVYGWFALNHKKYRIIKNVTIASRDGTTQIDHIIVSRYGIFVIETKNMKGWIYGSESQRQWIQVIYGKKTRFMNPLHQNYGHIKALSDLLDVDEDHLHSIIAFVGNHTFKTPMPSNVKSGLGCFDYIKSRQQHVFDQEEVEEFIQAIRTNRKIPSRATERAHIAHVKTKQQEAKNPAFASESSAPHCPKCGRLMVLRTIKKGPHAGGQFWGCPDFPRCKGTRKITQD